MSSGLRGLHHPTKPPYAACTSQASRTGHSWVPPQAEHRAHIADLQWIDEMKRVGGEIAAAEPRIDVLINNAGAMFGKRQLSADGLELTLAHTRLRRMP